MFAQTGTNPSGAAGLGDSTGRSRRSLSRRLASSVDSDPISCAYRRSQRCRSSSRCTSGSGLAGNKTVARDFRCAATSNDAYPERDDWSRDFEGPEDGATVQLRLYNIDRWGLAPAGARLLKKEVDGIYHVGVAVHGCEYWFDHQVNRLDLNDIAYVRGFGPAYVYDMGRTALSPEGVDEFVFGAMKDSYNIDTYDCFFHNCHHFANDVCLKLTNNRIPQWCIDHGEQGLSELSEESAKITRVVSNKIARIMMVSWGKYNKERFVERMKAKADNTSTESALDPMPLVGRGLPVNSMPEGVNNVGLSKLLGEEENGNGNGNGNGVAKGKESTREAVTGRTPA
ncbi:hypothetical protein BSKO_07121 [Bryopsis sp. KO-2023]|nr:hypothetical protein BSKO_07121 [Bryopsis sp. KO-2023]